MSRKHVLFVKFNSETVEREVKGDLRTIHAYLSEQALETIEYVLLEFDTGETMPGDTVQAVLNYCEFWDGVE